MTTQPTIPRYTKTVTVAGGVVTAEINVAGSLRNAGRNSFYPKGWGVPFYPQHRLHTAEALAAQYTAAHAWADARIAVLERFECEEAEKGFQA